MQRRPSWRQAPKFSVSKRSCFSYGKPPQHRCQRASNMIFKMTTPAKLRKMRGNSKKIPNFPHNILPSTPPSPSGTGVAAQFHATLGAHSAAVYAQNLGKIKSFHGTIRKFCNTFQRFRQVPPSKCGKPQHSSEETKRKKRREWQNHASLVAPLHKIAYLCTCRPPYRRRQGAIGRHRPRTARHTPTQTIGNE